MRALLILFLTSTSDAFVLPPICGTPPPTSRLDATVNDVIPGVAVATGLDILANTCRDRIWNGTFPEKDGDGERYLRQPVLYSAVDSIAISCRVYLGLVLGSFAVEFFPIPFDVNLRGAALETSLTVWLALTVSTTKRVFFSQMVAGKTLGRVALYDRLIDFLIGLLTTTVVLDSLGIDINKNFQSLFAASGVGALAFSLASRDLLENIVSGFVLQAYDAYDEGDDIRLGDGTEGMVKSIGLAETEIVRPDNIPVRIPNSQLNQRVSNLSRVKQSQVKQTLRFKYSDLQKLRAVLKSIEREILQSCPKLCSDGSKPFHAVLESYEVDHVTATVNCHFNIPPGGKEYALAKQDVILAIARAIDANGVEFALPSIVYRTPNPDQQQLMAQLDDFAKDKN